MKCPVCNSEVSKKWQTGGSAASRVPQWECSVCGGAFTRDELRPGATKPATTKPEIVPPGKLLE